MTTILILSCGTRNKLVRFFKEAFHSLPGGGRVIVTDCSPWAPALYEADAFYLVPPMKDQMCIRDRGKTYRIVDNSDTIRVSVRAPKSAISAIDAQSVTAKADLSEITDDGRVPIELSLSSGLDVEKITSDRQYVQLQVENKKTRQLSIEVAKNGTLPDGYATGRIDMETNTLSISGPESAVNAVNRAVVDISLDNVTANVEIDATIRLLDADGNEITSSEIRKNVDLSLIHI